MRICYLTVAEFPSRAAQSIQVMRMAQAFAEIGHRVTLITPSKCDLDVVSDFYGVRPIFDIQHLRRLRLKEVGLLLWGWQAAYRLRLFKPDMVYGRQVHGCYFAALLGYRVILEIHEPPSSRWSRKLFRKLVAMPSFVRLVTNSEGLARILKSEFVISCDKVLAAPNGADDPGTVRVKHPNGDRIRVGYVGHLYEGRGIELILALARICQWADFHLIGGTEEDVNYWGSKSTDLNNVSFHGFVPPATAEQYRQNCDILLAPYPPQTLTKRRRDASAYMSPLKLFEYMASGRAIVCAEHDVLHEIVNDQTAVLCSPDNLEDWVSALQRLRDDPSLRSRLGENARAAFLRDFTRTARASKILAGITVGQGVSQTDTAIEGARRADSQNVVH